MSKYTIDQAKAANLKAAAFLRNNVDKELPISFNGSSFDADGVWVTLFLSGTARILDSDLNSDALKSERQELECAFKYYRDVRKAAKSIAPSLIPKKIYTREGNRFVVFA